MIPSIIFMLLILLAVGWLALPFLTIAAELVINLPFLFIAGIRIESQVWDYAKGKEELLALIISSILTIPFMFFIPHWLIWQITIIIILTAIIGEIFIKKEIFKKL